MPHAPAHFQQDRAGRHHAVQLQPDPSCAAPLAASAASVCSATPAGAGGGVFVGSVAEGSPSSFAP
eukprot:13974103-Alexandrium_andersonii.AAC.1